MQVVVLAGGQGTRLRPLTYTTPKPLLPILGRPLIARVLDPLPDSVDEVILTVSYHAKAVRAWAEATQDPALVGRRVRVVEELEPLGTGGAIVNCRDLLTGPFLVQNGDIVQDLDIGALVKHHEQAGRAATLALMPVSDPSRFGVVDMVDEDRVVRFVEKPAPGKAPSDLVNAGTYVFEESVLDAIPRGRAVSIEREVFPVLAARDSGVTGHPFSGLWLDCGTPDAFLDVHEALVRRGVTHDRSDAPDAGSAPPAGSAPDAGSASHPGSAPDALPPGQSRPVRQTGPPGAGDRFDVAVAEDAVVAQDAVLSRVVVGPRARVASDARLVRCVLLAGARVGAAAHLEACVLGPDAFVGVGCRLTGCVVGPGERVPPGTVATDARFGLRGGDA